METSKKTGRIPELDGLRVLMIFIVSWFHIWQQSWLEPSFTVGETLFSLDHIVRSGYVWVDATILLSAFLMLLPLARKQAAGGTTPTESFSAREFYLRKARRILPGYWFIVLVVFIGICLPWDLYYGNGPYIVKDLFTHFTLIFPFWRDTYIYTPLGAASWTLAVVALGYLLFPLIIQSLHKHPVRVLCTMAGSAFAFRAWCLWGLTDYAMVVNTFVNFLDVYALGFASAMIYARLENRWSRYCQSSGHPSADAEKHIPTTGTTFLNAKAEQDSWLADSAPPNRKHVILWQILATVVFFGCLAGVFELQRVQAYSSFHAELQGRQMILRPAFALAFAGLILSAPFSLKPLRKLLGNRVTAFLAAISMNYYLIHQTLAVHMRRIGFPVSVSETPNMAGEQPWQTQYTLLAFGLSIAAAVLVTYLIEKPAGKWLKRKFGSHTR